MAANALEVLSLEDARLQCRADDGAEIDTLLTAAVNGAVSYVSRRTGIPLVDHQKIFNVSPKTNGYLILPVADVKAVVSVNYWETDVDSQRLAPAGSVSIGDLGRLEELDGGITRLWPPADDWPARLPGSEFAVSVTVGFDLDAQSESVKQAVILMTRLFFENPDRIESDFAVTALLEPWIRYNG